MHEIFLRKYLTLQEFCTCTQTYRKYADQIDPYPKNLEETLPALEALCQYILDPVIDHFGMERFQLTYGFCSKDLKRFLSQKDPETGIKMGGLIRVGISTWRMRRIGMASITAIASVLPVIFGLWGWRAIAS